MTLNEWIKKERKRQEQEQLLRDIGSRNLRKALMKMQKQREAKKLGWGG